MRASHRQLSGRIDSGVIDSAALRGNPLGDPAERPVHVYLPPGYDDSDERYPSVYVLQGYTGQVEMWFNRKPFVPTFPEAVDGAIASGDCPPVIVVLVDAWNAYGGSQYVDSPATGRYHSYVVDDVVPWVDGRYRTIPDRESRAVTGKSSGGFAAMITPMLRPDVFGALASHAGDSMYEYSYCADFAKSFRILKQYDGDVWAWWEKFRNRGGTTPTPDDWTLVMILGCSAAFSADEDGTVHLPFDTDTGRIRDDVWARWQAWDPVRMAPRHADALRSLRAVWLDGGTRDEWFLDVGAQAFRAELAALGVPDDRVSLELFDAGHMDIEYRYPRAISWLAHRLQR
jgi:hypothetical protein